MCSSSRLPLISKCCCFISLKVGAYLIGFLQTIVGLDIMIYALTRPIIEKQSDYHNSDNTDQNANLCVIGSAFSLLGFILLLGVKIQNFLLLRVYIVLEIIGLIVGFIFYLIILIYLFMAFVIASGESSNLAGDLIKIFAISTAQVLVVVIVVAFAIIIIIIALKAYFLFCVYSYLKELTKLRSGTPLAVGYTPVDETDDNNIKV